LTAGHFSLWGLNTILGVKLGEFQSFTRLATFTLPSPVAKSAKSFWRELRLPLQPAGKADIRTAAATMGGGVHSGLA